MDGHGEYLGIAASKLGGVDNVGEFTLAKESTVQQMPIDIVQHNNELAMHTS